MEFDKGGRPPPQHRHPGGRTCQAQALVLVVLFPLALPVLALRSAWLRKKGKSC